MRRTRPQLFMEMALLVAGQSTCGRGGTGAIIATPHDCNPVSTGYNGPPSGELHCQTNDCARAPDGGCLRSIHAERNAIGRMRRSFWDVPKVMFCTLSPCVECAVLIAMGRYNIETVYFNMPYRKIEGVEYLLTFGINVLKLGLNGYVEDQKTKLVWYEERPQLHPLQTS